MTITKNESGLLELNDAGDKLTGKFYADGSGKLTSHPAWRFGKLQSKYGKRQLDRAIQSAVSDGSSSVEPV